jgi:hypothetical protein
MAASTMFGLLSASSSSRWVPGVFNADWSASRSLSLATALLTALAGGVFVRRLGPAAAMMARCLAIWAGSQLAFNCSRTLAGTPSSFPSSVGCSRRAAACCSGLSASHHLFTSFGLLFAGGSGGDEAAGRSAVGSLPWLCSC